MSEDIQPILLRIGEVCLRLGMSRSSVYREIHNGNLRALKIGKSLRISQDELTRYVSSIPELVTALK
jgi:excisionase family DNA binding protein